MADPKAPPVHPPGRASLARRLISLRGLRKVLFGVVALLFFVLAIELLKAGARQGVGDFLRETLDVDTWWNAMGLGWLMAVLALSGSPIAATALTLFDARAIDATQTFFMIMGSRFGASFIVLLIGFLYHLRGHRRTTSLGMGVIALLTTAVIYLPAMPLGYFLLASDALSWAHLDLPDSVASVFDLLFDPIVSRVTGALHFGFVFLVGLGLVIAALNLFDRALPSITAQDLHVRNLADVVYKPWVMFAVGCAVTALTLSVSVSLSILVPLTVKGIIRRENVIPYVMGANITTFIDTLVASLLIDDPRGFTVVLVEMVSVAAVSIVILSVNYNRVETAILRAVRVVLDRTSMLVLFLAVFLAIPVVLAIL